MDGANSLPCEDIVHDHDAPILQFVEDFAVVFAVVVPTWPVCVGPVDLDSQAVHGPRGSGVVLQLL